MTQEPKPGFLLVAKRELRWLLHDRAALILIFGVPLFAFAVLTAVFSHPVIRGLGVVVVDADRSETSRAFVELVEASPGLSIVERAGDLSTAASAIRSGEAIGAVYVPADFERDLKAERRPQVVAFYNQQFLTAAGVASSGLSDSLAAAAKGAAARAAPKASRIGSLVAETIVLVNPQKNYAQFLLRVLLPVVAHVIITVTAGYAVGSEFRRRSMREWLACAGGNTVVALTGKLAPPFGIFFMLMLSVALILEGLLGISFKGDLPMMVAAGSLLIIGCLALGALLQLLAGELATGLGLTGLVVSPAFGYAGVGFPVFGMNAFAHAWGAILPVRWYMAVLLGQAARGLQLYESARPFAALAAVAVLYSLLAFLRLGVVARRDVAGAPEPAPAPAPAVAPPRGIGGAFAAEWRRVLTLPGALILLVLGPIVYGFFYPQPSIRSCARSRSRSSITTRASSVAGSCRRSMPVARSRWRSAPTLSSMRAWRSTGAMPSPSSAFRPAPSANNSEQHRLVLRRTGDRQAVTRFKHLDEEPCDTPSSPGYWRARPCEL
jgi:ABC-2 type transport system permease protein